MLHWTPWRPWSQTHAAALSKPGACQLHSVRRTPPRWDELGGYWTSWQIDYLGEEHKSNKSMPISSCRKSFNKNPLLDGLFGTWHQTEPLTAPHSTYVPKKVFVVPSRDLRWGHPGWTPSQKHASRKARREREGRCSNSRPGNQETLEGSQGLLASNTKVMQLQLTTLSRLR